jgi:hypothetical protein
MKYKVEFQYKSPDSSRPYDEVQDEEILFEHGEAIPIPNIGDSVTYLEGGNTVAYKVLSRHFSYLNNWCVVNIVVTDISSDEMASRLKE